LLRRLFEATSLTVRITDDGDAMPEIIGTVETSGDTIYEHEKRLVNQ
jgi:hypothetical protein